MRTRCLGLMPFESSGDERNAPLFTRDQWVMFYYRVKQWQYDISIGTSSGGARTTGSGIFSNLVVSGQSTLQNETGIILRSATEGSGQYESGYSVAWDWTIPPYIRESDDAYIPGIRLVVTQPDIEAISDPAQDVTGLDEQAFTATILGVGVDRFYSTETDLFFGSMQITPYTYWEYAKADRSNPIYNEFTGARLLNPHQTDELP